MDLFLISFVLFCAIAAGGLTMAGMIAAGMRVPPFMGMGHGLGALASLGVLLVACLRGGDATPDRAWWALAVLLAGLVGGLVLFKVLFVNRTPLALVAVHGSVAALGLYLLYGVVF